MPRFPRKFKSAGLRKTCKHLSADRCECPWVARIPGHRYINVSKWAGVPTSITRGQAADIRDEMLVELRRGTFNPQSKFEALHGESATFGDALNSYWKDEGSLLKGKAYPSYYRGWKERFGHHGLIAFATTKFVDIELWLKAIKAKSSEVNAHRWCEFGSRFFNWAIKRKWVKENPCASVNERIIGNGKARKRNTRITPEIEQALEQAGPQLEDWNFIRLWLAGALYLGVRRGELLRVQVKHVNYQTWVVTLPETKAQKEQQVYAMTEPIQKVLEARRFQGPDAFVFGDENGKAISIYRFERRWKAWFRAAGIPVGLKAGFVWHDMRHEYVSHLLDMGVPVHEVKDLARHADIQTTMGYVTTREERLKEAAKKMAIGRAG